MSDTVRLSISIQINTEDDDVDTGLTVEQWNALTDQERSAIYSGMWSDMAAGADGGGGEVLTPEAAEI